MKKLIILILLLFIFISCKKNNIEGIEIGVTLLENQSFAENKKLDTIIRKTLKGDYNSLRRLNHFPCGDGAGCYDKGFIITQIIYKIGENNFAFIQYDFFYGFYILLRFSKHIAQRSEA